MSFYLGVSLAVFALVAYDLITITGKTTWGARGHIMGMRPGATRRDDPRHFWILTLFRCHRPYSDPATAPSTSQFPQTRINIEKNGAPGEIRTPDPLLRRQMLYPAELRAHPWLLY
jgi:hypothetical protein